MRCESRDAGKNVNNQIALDRGGRLQLRAAFFARVRGAASIGFEVNAGF
jgi:hypothetical protein